MELSQFISISRSLRKESPCLSKVSKKKRSRKRKPILNEDQRKEKILTKLKLTNTSLFNLDETDIVLSNYEKSIIGLGLKFLPRYPLSSTKIKQILFSSINKYIRHLDLNLYFADLNLNDSFYNNINSSAIPIDNNNFIPPIDTKSITYKHILKKYKTNLNNYINFQNKWNCQLNKTEEFIIDELYKIKNNKSIIIKPADKNLGTVLMSPTRYDKMCLDILNDQSTYQLVHHQDFIPSAYDSLLTILKNRTTFNNPFITHYKTNRSLLQLKDSPNLKLAAHFYVLPKMHKKYDHVDKIAGRPIVSSINTITYHVSKYLDKKLQPIMKKLSTICFSSNHVLYKLSQLPKLNHDAVILCADVKSLYPSIPIDFGLKAVEDILLSYSKFSLDEISYILQLLHWVLTHNYISFTDSNNNTFIYKQISGTAMGTPTAVTYANIVLYYVESRELDKIGETISYNRYIDDLFIICSNKTQAELIITSFNKQHPNITLESITIDRIGIFLDLEIRINDDGTISTMAYQKPMNKYLYIPPTSNHSSLLLSNIITQEIKRYRILCTNDDDFNKIVQNFYSRLTDRGYSKSFLDPLFKSPPSRQLLLQPIFKRYKYKINNPIRNKKVRPIFITHQLKLVQPIRWKTFLSFPSDLVNHPLFLLAYPNMKEDIPLIAKKNLKSIGRLLCFRDNGKKSQVRDLSAGGSSEATPQKDASVTPV